jgi:hypothetical protein
MYLAPFPDLLDGVLALVSGVIFTIVAAIYFPIIILLEASLLRRLLPGIRAFLFSFVINTITFLLGAGAAAFTAFLLDELRFEPLQRLYYGVPDEALAILVVFGTFGLTVLIEGGILKILASEVPFTRVLRASVIINIASYVLLGVAAGVVALGYNYQDLSGGGFIGLVYIVTQCGVPLISIVILVGLVIENLISAQVLKKPKPVGQEVVGIPSEKSTEQGPHGGEDHDSESS